jgi:hypothetical protein
VVAAVRRPGNGGIFEFCQQKGILHELKAAISLAETCFWSSDLKLEKESDPETGDTKVVISLSIRGKSRQQVLGAYDAYRTEILRAVPWPQRGFMGLSYDIL